MHSTPGELARDCSAGIGQAKAEAIIAERTKSKFTSVDDLERVKGIGPAAMADLRALVTVSSAPAAK